jgi:hypothetical protein
MHSLVSIARSGMLADLTSDDYWTAVRRPDKISKRNRSGGLPRNDKYLTAAEVKIVEAEIVKGATSYEIAKLFVNKDRKRCAIEHYVRDIRKRVEVKVLSDKFWASQEKAL